jgi:peptidoglycan hydrolase CwlO-like protein
MVINIDKKQLILFAIGLILITVIVSILASRVDTSVSSVDPYQQKIDSLNIELKNIRNRQDILSSQIRRYKDSVNISNARIDSLGKELTSTQIYYGKKIKDLSGYSSAELYKFLTERYK